MPTCPRGPIDASFDLGGLTCGVQGKPAQMKNTGPCSTDMWTGQSFPDYTRMDLKYSPPAATGGTCTAQGTPQPLQVTYAASDRVCTPQTPPCTAGRCTPAFGAGIKVCVEATGAVSCPGTPFTEQHLIGGPATFTCSAGCTCQVSATCAGTMKLFTDGKCKNNELDVPADGACHNPSHPAKTYGSYQYSPAAPTGVGCAAAGASTAQNLALPDQHTVCCAP